MTNKTDQTAFLYNWLCLTDRVICAFLRTKVFTLDDEDMRLILRHRSLVKSLYELSALRDKLHEYKVWQDDLYEML